AYAGWRAEVRTAFHERGVIGSRGGQKQEVTYASAAGFAYQRHVQSEGGMHIGVKGALSIIPSDGSAPVTALTDTDRMDEDEPIIVLRERLAGVWQPRLIEQLENSGSVAWAPGVRLRRDGVQLDAAKGGAHLVPWSRIRAHWGDRFERSLVLLDASAATGRPAEARVVAEIDTGEPGFHAGKRLFEDLREAAPDRVDGNDRMVEPAAVERAGQRGLQSGESYRAPATVRAHDECALSHRNPWTPVGRSGDRRVALAPNEAA